MGRPRILFADNERDFLDTRAEFLEPNYEVIKAYTFPMAEQLLCDEWVHLAILDIRMVDNDNPRDISGLTLAKNETHRPVPKIILTNYPSYDYIRESLRPALDGLPPSVDFLAKEDGPDALLQAVADALATHMRINQALIFSWEDPVSAHQLVTMIEPDLASQRLLDRSSELEDLLRKLFYEDHQITINRLLTRGDGHVILEILVYDEAKSQVQYLVSCGQRKRINDESNRYDRLVPKGGSQGTAIKVKAAETTHFAASAYTLIGGIPEDVMTLREYYHRQPFDRVAAVLDHLFTATLVPWHNKSRFKAAGTTLAELYRDWLEHSKQGLSQDELEQRVKAICQETIYTGQDQLDYSPYKLMLQLPDGSSVAYPNPIPYLYAEQLPISTSEMGGVIHGRLNIDTILMGQTEQPWLVDYSHVTTGLLLRDFVTLETAIKFELLDTTRLYIRHSLEQYLLKLAESAHTVAEVEPESELHHMMYSIEQVHRHATMQIHCDRVSYLTGQLLECVERIAQYNPAIRYQQRKLAPYAHALLLSAMILQKIKQLTQPEGVRPPQASESMWIDEVNEEVWVEGRKIELTPQEYAILLYLYNHAGQLCSRQDLVKHALSEKVHATIDESKLNSAMSRMRHKVKSDSQHQYIVTKRGRGYMLDL